MGRYSKGILGPFSGKVGTVVGSTWNGIDYMKSLPKPSSKQPTDGQLEQRVKLALSVGFLKPLSVLLAKTFKKATVNNTGFNVALSLLIKNAITGTYPDYEIDYSKVLMSLGNLTGPWNAAVSSTTASEVSLAWTDNSGSNNALATDKAVLVVYNPVKNQYVFTMDAAARAAAAETLLLPAEFSGDTVHTWMAFVSADGKNFSTSVYLGTIAIL
ncbi:MAG: hypothetical protein K0S09_3178 [Sphingobacteriaceae bacterium]|jgi:hypothetical protein|nr:hypothetical protein [Sphingobacteriaceae bacterium]